MKYRRQFILVRNTFLVSCLLKISSLWAAEQQFINQQERQKALTEQLTPKAPDIHLTAPTTKNSTKFAFPQEKTCFQIQHVWLENADKMPFYLGLNRLAKRGEKHCLGSQGINLLMNQLQNRLVEHGYTTTRILAPAQNLSQGKLHLLVLPGKIHQVKLTDDSGHYLQLYSSFPAHAGNLLNLRDIEQGLENLQRLPTVQADMEIVPAKQPGESDILIHWQQPRMWRVDLNVNDAGSNTTGRYQAGATLSLDNPFSLSDLLYVSASHDLTNRHGKGSKNYFAYYSLPLGYWNISLSGSDYDYRQNFASLDGDAHYSGNSKSLDWQISRILHRDSRSKTTLSYDLLVRQNRNFINDTEIEVQRRRTSSWQLALTHHRYLQQAVLDLGISYQQGTRWFGALPAPEEFADEATALNKIITLNAQLDLPFQIATQGFHYNVQYLLQSSHTPLTPLDQLAIGNRYTVRGFDGERTLNGSHGWYLRNDLAWQTPLANQQLYLGVDYGEVGGYSGDYQRLGKQLAGGVLGLRGQAFSTTYDLFAGIPLSKPDGFKTSPVTLGFNLTWHY